MKIYTKGGDQGLTSLVGGERVSKSDIRVDAYGDVDELISTLALLGDLLSENAQIKELGKDINRINGSLMWVAAILASAGCQSDKIIPVKQEEIDYLESEIDRMQAELKPITKFTLPGGNKCVSMCNLCRTVCRRAERKTVMVASEHSIFPTSVTYLNRLSDYLYTLGRTLSERLNVREIYWEP